MAEANILTTVTIATCTLNIAFNITAISIILLVPHLRNKPKHMLIVSISLADLIVGWTHVGILVNGGGEQVCHHALKLQVSFECLGYFIVGWTMVTLNIMTIVQGFQNVDLLHNLAYLVTILSCRRFSNSRSRDVIGDQSARPANGYDDSRYCQQIVPAVTYVICHLPLVTYTWIWFIHRWLPTRLFSTLVTTFVLSRPFLQTLSWMVCKDLREEVREIYRHIVAGLDRCGRQRVTTTATSVSYNMLQESEAL
ncbi:hypothetical protein Btru_064515 [Bulinus truncatus]|nr:hypothetical protein Btru_064515 [Bulinus truncatus]